MDFAADIRHWASVADFEAHLAAHNPAICSWVKWLTTHHTWSPTVDQWHGRQNIDNLLRFYRDTKKWAAGPQLFVAPDGIWQLTPLNEIGVHAGRGNSVSIGIEVVGDYDNHFWEEPIRSLSYGVHVALLRWLSLSGDRVRGHREWGSEKSCPGWAVDMDHLRRDLGALLAARIPTPAATQQLTAESSLFGPPTATADQVIRFINERGSAYNPYDVRVIVGHMFDVAPMVGVNPAIVAAQTIHETSAQIDSDPGLEPLSSPAAQRPYRNGAGIGKTDDLAVPVAFPTWLDSIQAQVGRELRYFLPPDKGTPAQKKLMEAALRWRPLAAKMHGSATQLKHLGAVHNPTGNGWADPGDQYGATIAQIANALAAM